MKDSCENYFENQLQPMAKIQLYKASISKRYLGKLKESQDYLIKMFGKIETSKDEYEESFRAYKRSQKKLGDSVSGQRSFKAIMTAFVSESERVKLFEQQKKEAKLTLNKKEAAYIFNLAASNVAQCFYYEKELQQILSLIDGNFNQIYNNFWTKQKEFLESKSQIALSLAEKIQQIEATATKEEDHELFMQLNHSVFVEDPATMDFQPLEESVMGCLTINEDNMKTFSSYLMDKIRKKDHNQAELNKSTKSRDGLRNLALVYETSPTHGDPSSIIESKVRLECTCLALERAIKQYGAQVNLLKAAGVQESQEESVSYLSSDSTLKNCSSFHSAEPLRQCRALYDHTAASEGEINLYVGCIYDIIEGDINGWSRVCSAQGEVGFVPSSYLELIGNVYVCTQDYQCSETDELDFATGDKIVVFVENNEICTGKNMRTMKEGKFRKSMTKLIME